MLQGRSFSFFFKPNSPCAGCLEFVYRVIYVETSGSFEPALKDHCLLETAFPRLLSFRETDWDFFTCRNLQLFTYPSPLSNGPQG